MTHCAMNARRSPRTGHMHGQIHISCPTCRSDVSGEVEIVTGTGSPLGREQFERVVVPGSEPDGLPTFVPRAPRIAFPEHVNRDDGRLHAVARGTGFNVDERGHGSDAASSTGSAPAAPARAAPPAQAQGGRDTDDYAMARGSASGGARARCPGAAPAAAAQLALRHLWKAAGAPTAPGMVTASGPLVVRAPRARWGPRSAGNSVRPRPSMAPKR